MLIKDYLGYENARNKTWAKLYETLIKRAYGPENDVLIGHHLTFESHGDITTENEVPAADTLLFDHEIMGRIFGRYSVPLMQRLCTVTCDERERMLAAALSEFDKFGHLNP